jgi:transcriptional regulator with XRE-family HTH domain
MVKKEVVLRAFGQALAARRKTAQLTQESLAELSGLHRNYIGDLERGERNPTLTTLVSLARALECSPGDLVDGAT